MRLKKYSYYRPSCKICERIATRLWQTQNEDRFKYLANRNREYIKKEFPWKKHLRAAKARCTDPNKDNYSSYGLKGIKFLLSDEDGEHLWHKYNADLMDEPNLDRIDGNGNYEVNNCQFLDRVIHEAKNREEQLKRQEKLRKELPNP